MDVLGDKKMTIQITGLEAKEHLRIYKSATALKSIQSILEKNPERITEFGFKKEDFLNLEKDIEQVNRDYQKWCMQMEEKYGILFTGDILFNIDYVEKTISY